MGTAPGPPPHPPGLESYAAGKYGIILLRFKDIKMSRVNTIIGLRGSLTLNFLVPHTDLMRTNMSIVIAVFYG